MTKHSVHCVARDRAPADRILHHLKEAGYANTTISLLFVNHRAPPRNDSATPVFVPSPASLPSSPSSTDIRGVVAWLDGVRAVVIPGAAPLIVAGPLAAAFRPASVDCIADALSSIGLPETEARDCVRQVLAGGFFIAVQSDQLEAAQRARDIIGSAKEGETITRHPKAGDPGELEILPSAWAG